MNKVAVTLRVNGATHDVLVEPRKLLSDALRAAALMSPVRMNIGPPGSANAFTRGSLRTVKLNGNPLSLPDGVFASRSPTCFT